MSELTEARERLQVIRGLSEIPRLLVIERGYSTGLLASDDPNAPARRAERARLRENTNAARDRVLELRRTLVTKLDDADSLGREIDNVNARFDALQKMIDSAYNLGKEERRAAVIKILTDNAAFNNALRRVMDDQVRRLALLDGVAYRYVNHAAVAWSLRDLGGQSASFHKDLIGRSTAPTLAEQMRLVRSQAVADHIVTTLMPLRNDPNTPASVVKALDQVEAVYVGRFVKVLRRVLDEAIAGKITIDHDSYYKESQPGLATAVLVRDAFYDAAQAVLEEHYGKAHFGFLLALSGLISIVVIAAAVMFVVRRSVTTPIADLTSRMSGLAAGDIERVIPHVERHDEMGAMAKALLVFRDGAREKIRMERAAEDARIAAEVENRRVQQEAISTERALVVRSFGTGMARLAEKDLSFRLQDQVPEAYATLQADFNRAVDALEAALGSVDESSQTISGSTGEIAVAATDLARRTEAQAASLEQTAAAVEQITSTSHKASEGAAHAREVVSKAKADAEKTGVVVRKAVAAIGNIEKSSAQMSHIIGVIDEIAFQTNLLALNAGVEAARAGDAGRGFAVVASEVRGLAQRSAEAAKEIKGLIQSSTSQVTEGVQLVSATGEALERILTQVDDINKVVADIASGAQMQATGLSEINTAINQMDQSTQQNAAMVEETTTASAALEQQARQLRELIGAFQLSQTATSASPKSQRRRRAA